MKFLYILNSFPRPSETFVDEEILQLKKLGIEVDVLRLNVETHSLVHDSARNILKSSSVYDFEFQYKRHELAFRIAKTFLENPIKITQILGSMPWKRFQKWKNNTVLFNIAKILDEQYDYIHAHFAVKNLEYAAILSAALQIPHGVTLHHYDIFNSPMPVNNLKKLLLQSNLVITISNYNKKYIDREILGSQRSDGLVKVAYLGVQTGFFTPQATRIPTKTEPLRLLCVARLEKAKGYDILFDAIAKLTAEGLKITLRVVGDGSQKEELKSLVARLGIEDRVQFLGYQNQDSVKKEMDWSDALVLGSRSEGLPIVIMESMAMRRPVIAPEIQGIPEIVTNNVDGLMYEMGDSDALAACIEYLIRERESLAQMGLNARHKVERQFERSNNTVVFLELVKSTIQRFRSRGTT